MKVTARTVDLLQMLPWKPYFPFQFCSFTGYKGQGLNVEGQDKYMSNLISSLTVFFSISLSLSLSLSDLT